MIIIIIIIVVECRTRDPEVPGSNPGVAKKENLLQVQSEQYHHQSFCTRVKYLKLSEQNGDPPKSQTYPLYEHI